MKSVYDQSEAANRYDSARSLPEQSQALWLNILKSLIPKQKIGRILDLGCGTGRFTSDLGKAFECPVIGVEPSRAMLSLVPNRHSRDIEWREGQAENIPLENNEVDLVFMSQVMHHLVHPERAFREINRVLTSAGYLVIRNSTREHLEDFEWLRFFPGAFEIETKRLPSQKELTESVCRGSFEPVEQQTVFQLFADSYTEYFEKISRRGLSALIAISDEAFQNGLEKFQNWVIRQPQTRQIYEPVNLFVFQKIRNVFDV